MLTFLIDYSFLHGMEQGEIQDYSQPDKIARPEGLMSRDILRLAFLSF